MDLSLLDNKMAKKGELWYKNRFVEQQQKVHGSVFLLDDISCVLFSVGPTYNNLGHLCCWHLPCVYCQCGAMSPEITSVMICSYTNTTELDVERKHNNKNTWLIINVDSFIFERTDAFPLNLEGGNKDWNKNTDWCSLRCK